MNMQYFMHEYYAQLTVECGLQPMYKRMTTAASEHKREAAPHKRFTDERIDFIT